MSAIIPLPEEWNHELCFECKFLFERGDARFVPAVVLLVVGVPVVLYVAPQVERYPNLPDDREQIQQIIQHWHGPQLPSIKAPTGEVFTVSIVQ